MKEVLDSTFLFAFFASKDVQMLSRAREKLARLRKERRGIIPSIVVAELVNLVCREGGREKALAQMSALEHAGFEIVPLDARLARAAGLLRCIHRDLPMADCVIAATALRVQGRVVTDDPHFAKVKGLRTTWI